MPCLNCTDYLSLHVSYSPDTTCSTCAGDIVVTSINLKDILSLEVVTISYNKITCENSTPISKVVTSSDITVSGNNYSHSFKGELTQGLYKFTLTRVKTECTITETYILFIDVNLRCKVIDYTLDNKPSKIQTEVPQRLKPLLLHYAINNAQGCVCDEDKMKLLYDELLATLNTKDDCGC